LRNWGGQKRSGGTLVKRPWKGKLTGRGVLSEGAKNERPRSIKRGQEQKKEGGWKLPKGKEISSGLWIKPRGGGKNQSGKHSLGQPTAKSAKISVPPAA